MNYQEAVYLSLLVKWKVTFCDQGEKCWCRGIEPETPIISKDGERVYVVRTGEILREHAEHIVELHNTHIKGTKK